MNCKFNTPGFSFLLFFVFLLLTLYSFLLTFYVLRFFLYASLPLFHLPLRFPAVPRRTSHRQDPAALVRRSSGRLDHRHAVLPGAADRRVCLCRLVEPGQPPPGRAAPAPARPVAHPAAGTGPGMALPPHPFDRPETKRDHPADAGYLPAAGHLDRSAVLPALIQQYPGAGLVCTGIHKSEPLPPVCPLQLQFPGGAAGLSIRGRAQFVPALAGLALVARLPGIRRAGRLRHFASHAHFLGCRCRSDNQD